MNLEAKSPSGGAGWLKSKKTWIIVAVIAVVGAYGYMEDSDYGEDDWYSEDGMDTSGMNESGYQGYAAPAGNNATGNGAYGSGSAPSPGGYGASDGGYGNNPNARPSGGGGVVQIIDRGLQMPRSSIQVPQGWTVNQDVASNPTTGEVVRYVVDIIGPQGEVVKNAPPTPYFGHMGQSFQQAWQQAAHSLAQGVLQNLQLGGLQPSPTLQRIPIVQRVSQSVNLQPLEASLRGTRNGQSYAGRAYLLHMPIQGGSGQFTLELVMSPERSLQQTLATHEQIMMSAQSNPQFERTVQQLSERAMNKSTAAHNQRMAANQRQFEAHQQSMRSTSQANDRANQQWMNDFRSSGGYSSDASGGQYGDYSGHNAYVDGIHEQQTFGDPSSGQQVQMDGQYDYNYTDGLGNYYGTNDPSFDPNSLQGSWQATQPMQATP